MQVTRSKIIYLAIPMILANLTIPLIGMVDIAVVGHLSVQAYVGAIAVGAMIFDMIYWVMGFLRMGTTGLIAQARGRNDGDTIRSLLAQSVILALIIAALILLIQQPLAWFAFKLVSAPAQVTVFAKHYYFIRIWGAPAALLNIVLFGWFLGMQRMRIPLLLLLFVNLLGIALDFYFVWGLHFNVAGVAWAAVIAQYAGLAFGLYLMKTQLKRYPGNWIKSEILDWHKIKSLLHVNKNIFIRTLCLMSVFSFMTIQSARFGTVILAANAILMNLQYFMSYALDGFTMAIETLIGHSIGQQDKELFKLAIKRAGECSFVVAIVYGLVYMVFGTHIIKLMTSHIDIQNMTNHFLPWLMISPIISVWSYIFDGIFIGATKAAAMRNSMIMSAFVFFFPVWYLTRGLGNNGLWLAFMIFMGARGVTMLYQYRSIERSNGFINV